MATTIYDDEVFASINYAYEEAPAAPIDPDAAPSRWCGRVVVTVPVCAFNQSLISLSRLVSFILSHVTRYRFCGYVLFFTMGLSPQLLQNGLFMEVRTRPLSPLLRVLHDSLARTTAHAHA
jgi:hypothetical protein